MSKLELNRGTMMKSPAVNKRLTQKQKAVRSLTSRQTQLKVRHYLAATQAKNTQKAYQNDLAQFLRCGGKIPATP